MARFWKLCSEHPLAALIFLGGTVAGAALAVHFELGPAELPTWKRAVGGGLAGAFMASFPLGSWLFD